MDAISALGVPETQTRAGETFVSTRHAVMNATFVASGVRVVLAGLVLAPFVPRRGRLPTLLVLLLHGAGTIIVGLFPDGPSATMHGLGAGLAIIGGAVLLVLLTLVLARRHPALATVTACCAAVSVAGCLLVPVGIWDFGLVERMAVDAVLVWQVVAGALVLVTRPPERSAAVGQGE